MTDLKTVIQITYPDDGISVFVLYVIVHRIWYNNNNNNNNKIFSGCGLIAKRSHKYM